MLSESKLSDLTESLVSGFFADKLVFLLARVSKSHSLTEKDRALLEKAVQFFNNVLKGHNWLEDPQLSRNSMESANAFSQAVRAISPDISSRNFVQYMQELQDVASTLLVKGTADEPEVKKLRGFFSNYGRSELVRTENLLNDDGVEIFT